MARHDPLRNGEPAAGRDWMTNPWGDFAGRNRNGRGKAQWPMRPRLRFASRHGPPEVPSGGP